MTSVLLNTHLKQTTELTEDRRRYSLKNGLEDRISLTEEVKQRQKETETYEREFGESVERQEKRREENGCMRNSGDLQMEDREVKRVEQSLRSVSPTLKKKDIVLSSEMKMDFFTSETEFTFEKQIYRKSAQERKLAEADITSYSREQNRVLEHVEKRKEQFVEHTIPGPAEAEKQPDEVHSERCMLHIDTVSTSPEENRLHVAQKATSRHVTIPIKKDTSATKMLPENKDITQASRVAKTSVTEKSTPELEDAGRSALAPLIPVQVPDPVKTSRLHEDILLPASLNKPFPTLRQAALPGEEALPQKPAKKDHIAPIKRSPLKKKLLAAEQDSLQPEKIIAGEVGSSKEVEEPANTTKPVKHRGQEFQDQTLEKGTLVYLSRTGSCL